MDWSNQYIFPIAGILAIIGIFIWAFTRIARSRREVARAVNDRLKLVDFIHRFAGSISYSSDIEEWMDYVAESLRYALDASALWIFSYKSETTLELIAFSGNWHGEEIEASRQNRQISETLPRKEINLNEVSSLVSEIFPRSTTEGVIFPHMEETHGQGPLYSLMSSPIQIGEDVMGVVIAANPQRYIGNKMERSYFDANDLFLLQAMAIQVGLGMTFIQIYEELSEKHRIEQEVQLAQEIQRSLLPEDPPQLQDNEIHGVCRAARQVSGDFYDFIWISPTLLLIVIADASGKGIPACMVAAMVRSMIRMIGPQHRDDLEVVMAEMNSKLYHDTEDWQFITMGCLLLDLSDSTVEYIRSGHTPLVIRYPNGEVHTISPTGPALGLVPPELGPRFESFAFSLQPGMQLIMFTDGLNEAMNTKNEQFGLERMLDVIREADCSAVDTVNLLLQAVDKFSQGTVQADDQTLVVLRHVPKQR